jgi:hypothetical protein
VTFDELADEFDRLAELAADPPLEDAINQIKGMFANSVDANFQGQHDPDGNPWPDPLRPLRPVHKRPDHLLLVKTGALRESAITSIREAEYNSHGFTVEPAWLPYGEFHQTGTSNVEQRQFSGWGQQLLDDATEVLQIEYISILTGRSILGTNIGQ